MTDSDGGRIALRPDEVKFSTSPKALAGADIVILCVKSIGTADAAKEIGRHAPKKAAVISFQNGVSNVDLLKEKLPKATILRGTVPFNVASLGNGRWHKGVAGTLMAEDHEVTRALAERIGNRPGRLRLSDDMVGVAWGKLLINLNNAINALSGRPLLAEIRERDYRRVFAAAMREGLGILNRAGIRPAKVGDVAPRLMPMVIDSPDWLFNRLFIKRWKIDAKARSSMSDDLAHGRKTEVDYINGELVALAQKIGMASPINSKIVELIRAAEAGAKPWAPAALRREVLGGSD